MASRKDQKAELRREREEREAAAKAAARRRRLIGYAAAGAVVLAALIVAGVLLASGEDDGGKGGGSGAVLPEGGEVPAQKLTDLEEAAKAAGCELKSVRAKSREHATDLAESVAYDSKPPTSGKHFEVPAEDGEYEAARDVKELVHALEHGRVIIWFKKGLPAGQRANLKALFDEDPYQMIVTPDPSGMTYPVAATAWNADPQPNGTGRLLGCPRFTPEVFDAIRAFKDEHRSNGPEPVP